MTLFDGAEKYASGDYPNAHAGGDGLPRYVEKNRPIENGDFVLWHSFGHTHVCKPEDFPIMPVEYAGFNLKPNGFFDRNIAMNLSPSRTGTASARGAMDRSCRRPLLLWRLTVGKATSRSRNSSVLVVIDRRIEGFRCSAHSTFEG